MNITLSEQAENFKYIVNYTSLLPICQPKISYKNNDIKCHQI